MHIYCPVSCDTCPEPRIASEEEDALLLEVAKYGKPQKVEGKDAKVTLEVIEKTVDYMKNVVLEGGVDLSEDIVGECTNKEECESCLCCLYFELKYLLCGDCYCSGRGCLCFVYSGSDTTPPILYSVCILGCHWRMSSQSRVYEAQMRAIVSNM